MPSKFMHFIKMGAVSHEQRERDNQQQHIGDSPLIVLIVCVGGVLTRNHDNELIFAFITYI